MCTYTHSQGRGTTYAEIQRQRPENQSQNHFLGWQETGQPRASGQRFSSAGGFMAELRKGDHVALSQSLDLSGSMSSMVNSG